MGYSRAGFDVVGVDIEPQPNYPFRFIQGDALTIDLNALGFDAYHASPPCQGGLKGLASVNRALGRTYDHPDLLDATRARLKATGKPYIIEQPQMGAQMVDPVVCCGSSFGLPIRRHRQFEASVPLVAPPCNHRWQIAKRFWTSWQKDGERQRATVIQVYGNGGERDQWPAALDIDWMTPEELTQAIPPAYTEFLGRQMLAWIRNAQVAVR